jgi:hypothetical protein
VALFELRRLRLLGRGPVESLRVFQAVSEMSLRRPLKPQDVAALVSTVNFQVEFATGREFVIRVRGEGIALLNRTRQVLEVVGASGKR